MFRMFHPPVKDPPDRSPLRLTDSDQVAFVMQEYAAVWEEIHTSLASQVSVLSFGAATVGLLVSAAAQLWITASLVAGLMLLLAVPAVCFVALAIYLGEQVRLMRAGLFLNRLEEALNRSARQSQHAVAPGRDGSANVLTWEHWTSIHQRAGDIDRHNRWAIILVFALLGATSVGAGYLRLHTAADLSELWAVLAFISAGVLATLSFVWLARLASYADAYRGQYAAAGTKPPTHA